MYQVAFTPAAFATVVPWLMLSYSPLGILIHPRTGADFADHTTHALWLRQQLPLRLEALAQSGPA
jgi:DOPA 4,5-dioxygenase